MTATSAPFLTLLLPPLVAALLAMEANRRTLEALRDGVPLIVDDSDRIVWVAGHGIDEAFRVTDASQAVVILKLRPV